MANIIATLKSIAPNIHLSKPDMRKTGRGIIAVLTFGFFCVSLFVAPTLWWMTFNIRFTANGMLADDCIACLAFAAVLGIIPFFANLIRAKDKMAKAENTLNILEIARFLATPYLVAIGITALVLVSLSLSDGRLATIIVALFGAPVLGIVFGAPFLAAQTFLCSRTKQHEKTNNKNNE